MSEKAAPVTIKGSRAVAVRLTAPLTVCFRCNIEWISIICGEVTSSLLSNESILEVLCTRLKFTQWLAISTCPGSILPACTWKEALGETGKAEISCPVATRPIPGVQVHISIWSEPYESGGREL